MFPMRSLVWLLPSFSNHECPGPEPGLLMSHPVPRENAPCPGLPRSRAGVVGWAQPKKFCPACPWSPQEPQSHTAAWHPAQHLHLLGSRKAKEVNFYWQTICLPRPEYWRQFVPHELIQIFSSMGRNHYRILDPKYQLLTERSWFSSGFAAVRLFKKSGSQNPSKYLFLDSTYLSKLCSSSGSKIWTMPS